MLSQMPDSRGVTLIELMVTLLLFAVLLTVAAPSLSDWSANARVRGTAERLQSSLRLAQTEAMRRNRQVLLQLTSQTPGLSASADANGSAWLVRSLPLLSGETATDADFILDDLSPRQTGTSLTGPALLCFNPVGQLVSNTSTGLGASCNAPTDATIPVSYTLGTSTTSRRWRVQIYLGGLIRLCNPARTLSDSTPDGC